MRSAGERSPAQNHHQTTISIMMVMTLMLLIRKKINDEADDTGNKDSRQERECPVSYGMRKACSPPTPRRPRETQTARAVSDVSSKDVPPHTETVMGRSHGRLTCLLHGQMGFFVCSTFSDERWHFTSAKMATFLFQISLCSSQNLPFFPLQLNLCIGGFPKVRDPQLV